MRSSPSNGTKPLVYLVAPHPLAAEYLRVALRNKSRLRVVSQEELLLDAANGRQDPVFLLDKGSLPSPIAKFLGGLRLRLRYMKIIVLDRDCPAEEQFRLLALGIRGVVAYKDVARKLAAAITEVATGGLWVQREILTQYVAQTMRDWRPCELPGTLTEREHQVLQLVQRKFSNKEIGAALLVSESTVKFHLANIYGKLGVRSRQSAVELAQTAVPPAIAQVPYELQVQPRGIQPPASDPQIRPGDPPSQTEAALVPKLLHRAKSA